MTRFIAFYLPQYHPTPQNDAWWGKGFTEWTNVAKAKPLFKGHYQPHIPADLGFYDLRMPLIREQQVELAREAGIEGFCYWHYWFGKNKQILERPFNEVLISGQPDFPFCLGWANESWSSKSWTNQKSFSKDCLLLEQTYDVDDYIKHFYYLLPAFKDKRYITVDGKPLFYVYRPLNIPNIREFIDLWNCLALKNGLCGIHFVAMTANVSYRDIGKVGIGKVRFPNTNKSNQYYNYLLQNGFDAVNSRGNARAEILLSGKLRSFIRMGLNSVLHINVLKRYNQKEINKKLFVEEDKWENVYPTIMPCWDRSPRSGREATIYTNSTPKVFEDCVKDVINIVKDKEVEHQIVFIQSWNEWGEGNYMEPDLKYGKGYIYALKNGNNNYEE